MNVGDGHGHDGEPMFFQKLGAFDYGMNGLCEGGAWGLGQLEDCFRQMGQQCTFVSIKYICNGKFIGSSKNSPNSYNSYSSSYMTTSSSSQICPCHSPFLFLTSTTNTTSSRINNTGYFLYSRSRSCDERPNCLAPLVQQSRL
jgi:hypothetical protein